MTPALEALARRAVAAPGWRWMAGMLDNTGSDVGTSKASPPAKRTMPPSTSMTRPSRLSDAATLGCLLALVREKHQSPGLYAYIATTDGRWKTMRANYGDQPECATEAEALVAALEAQ